MNIVCASLGIVDFANAKQGLSEIESAGFSDVLLDFSSTSLKDKRGCGRVNVETFLQFQSECFQSTIACIPSLLELNGLEENEYLLFVETCIEDAGKIGCKAVIIPPVACELGEVCLQRNIDFYLNLIQVAKESKVMILLENQYYDFNGHIVRGAFSGSSEICRSLAELNKEAKEEVFGFCLNVGKCTLCKQNIYELTISLNKHLKAVILTDSNGYSDSVLLPYSSVDGSETKTDWKDLILGLRKIEFDGEMILDFTSNILVFPPTIRKELIQFAYTIGVYFKWQIEMEMKLKSYQKIVLFGAGKMCEKYMKTYGGVYTPKFTCDNNQQLWGKSMFGLVVKNPLELKNLPEEYAIFICNVHYQEIEEQLRLFNLKNPIERFSDENI